MDNVLLYLLDYWYIIVLVLSSGILWIAFLFKKKADKYHKLLARSLKDIKEKDDATAILEKKLAETISEKSKLEKQNKSACVELSELKKSISAGEHVNKKLNKEKNELKKQLDLLLSETDRLKDDLKRISSQAERDLTDLQKNYNVLLQEKSTLADETARLKLENEKHNAIISTLEENISKLKEKREKENDTPKINTTTKEFENVGQRIEIRDDKELSVFDYKGEYQFDNYLGESDHFSFPSIKTPCLNTKILSPVESVNRMTEGVVEPLLKKQIEVLCDEIEDLMIVVNCALPIRNRDYSYHPDIALFWKTYGLYIDIEIDEPYDICSRKPIHYVGSSDNLRDRYFIRNGWVVMRYCEKQVKENVEGVVAHIKNTLLWIAGEPIKLCEHMETNRWTYHEAISMAEIGEREKYLEINEDKEQFNEERDEIKESDLKPDEDILPDEVELNIENELSTQIEIARSFGYDYLRLTKKNGYQTIINTKSVEIKDDILLCDNVISGTIKKDKIDNQTSFKTENISMIEGISNLFSDTIRDMDLSNIKTVIFNAFVEGIPIFMKYNSRADHIVKERFVSSFGFYFEHGMCYIRGFCSYRKEWRTFALDNRITELRIVNCKKTFYSEHDYASSLGGVVMHGNEKQLRSVRYLLEIMPQKEKNVLVNVGNIANYYTINGKLDDAFKLYTKYEQDEMVAEIYKNWGDACKEDIEYFISKYEKFDREKADNFRNIKRMLIEAGWSF